MGPSASSPDTFGCKKHRLSIAFLIKICDGEPFYGCAVCVLQAIRSSEGEGLTVMRIDNKSDEIVN